MKTITRYFYELTEDFSYETYGGTFTISAGARWNSKSKSVVDGKIRIVCGHGDYRYISLDKCRAIEETEVTATTCKEIERWWT